MNYANQLASAVLLFVCLGSFAWGMKKFFVQPAGMTLGMKLIAALGVIFGLTHLVAILAVSPIVEQSVAADAFYLCSAALFWWAIRSNTKRQLSAAFSPDVPCHLVQQGPYRFIRHPFYCSYLLFWLAGYLATGKAWLFATFAVMLAVYLVAAKQEERKFMRSPLSQAYRQYRSCTGMFLPNVLKVFRTGKPTGWNTRLETPERAS